MSQPNNFVFRRNLCSRIECDKLDYIVMLGNNLSTLGVSAAQLNNNFDTLSTSLVWTPTTGEFGPGFGDFEDHQKVATRLAAHFTRSDEDKQSQPNSDGFENTQITSMTL